MYCQKCGTQINNGDRFCQNCGTPAEQDESTIVNTSVETQQQTVSAPQYANGTYNIPSSNDGVNNGYTQISPQIPPQMAVNDADYKIAAKNNWYCYLFPILFFLPILNENKNIPGNKDVANNVLWLFILNVGNVLLKSIFANTSLYGLFSFVNFGFTIFAIVVFITVCCGKAMRVPVLDKVKIIK